MAMTMRSQLDARKWDHAPVGRKAQPIGALRLPLEARCPHRANSFRASGPRAMRPWRGQENSNDPPRRYGEGLRSLHRLRWSHFSKEPHMPRAATPRMKISSRRNSPLVKGAARSARGLSVSNEQRQPPEGFATAVASPFFPLW